MADPVWTALIILQTMTAVPQTVVTLNQPSAATTLTFASKELCDAAAKEIGKQATVSSVTCVQTNWWGARQ